MKREKTDAGQNQESDDELPRRNANGGRDPSGNVLDLVDAATQRQDDLRNQAARYDRYIEKLRDDHAKELREAEAARIDANRAFDNQAVQQASTVADTRAEALRTQVQDAEAARVTALDAALAPIRADVVTLNQKQWENQGQKAQVVETQAKGLNTTAWIAIGIAGTALVCGTFLTMVSIIVGALAVTHGFK